jgi:4-alpha-glucanotransferase
MVSERVSGVLLHITSLPSYGGVGDLGPAAYAFVDFLASGKQRLWQVLPLNPTGYGSSPYSALSAFAGNPLLISLERLVDAGWLTPDRIDHLPATTGRATSSALSMPSVPSSKRPRPTFSTAPQTKSAPASSASPRTTSPGSPIGPFSPSSAAASTTQAGLNGRSNTPSVTPTR